MPAHLTACSHYGPLVHSTLVLVLYFELLPYHFELVEKKKKFSLPYLVSSSLCVCVCVFARVSSSPSSPNLFMVSEPGAG